MFFGILFIYNTKNQNYVQSVLPSSLVLSDINAQLIRAKDTPYRPRSKAFSNVLEKLVMEDDAALALLGSNLPNRSLASGPCT